MYEMNDFGMMAKIVKMYFNKYANINYHGKTSPYCYYLSLSTLKPII